MSSSYNVRGAIGKRKGQFIKSKLKKNIESFVERTKGKQGRKIEVSLFFIYNLFKYNKYIS